MRLATIMIWSLATVPVVIALIIPNGLSWHSPIAVLNNLGRLTGVAGLSFMLVAAVLSCRVPGFDRPFGGLTKLWQTHHQLAAVAFLCLLAHPLFLAFASGSAASGIDRLFPSSTNWAIWAGWGALLVMMIFLAPSFAFFGEPEYQRWKHLHKLAGVAIVLALIHAFPLAHAIPHPWDILIWLFLTALAIGAVAYRWLFSRFAWPGKGGRFRYSVTKVEPITSNVVEISLQSQARQLHYSPGQFVYLTPYDKQLSAGYGEEHPYTLSSSPTESGLRIAIKDLGDASHAMQTIREGADVRIEGPYGAFFKNKGDEDSEIWIAGGIGVTPFLSRARYLSETENEVDVCMIYCVQDETRALFMEEFKAISQALPGFVLAMHYFYQQGPLSGEFIERNCPHLDKRSAHICGPLPLLGLARHLLLTSGVPAKRICTEEFNLL